jgi:hypothetical protein
VEDLHLLAQPPVLRRNAANSSFSAPAQLADLGLELRCGSCRWAEPELLALIRVARSGRVLLCETGFEQAQACRRSGTEAKEVK